MKNHSDCEQFYDDMETLGGTSNILTENVIAVDVDLSAETLYIN